MREPVSYRCDGCGIVGQCSGDWLSIQSNDCLVIHYGCVDDADGHYCGQACAIKAISGYLSADKPTFSPLSQGLK